jgi:AraC-like DNA-binding protein
MNGAADSGPKPIRTRNQQASTYARYATGDRDEAERVITQLYLPNRLDLSRDQTPLRMEVSGLRVGALTAGRIAYGRNVRLRTADAEHFHVNIPLRGRAVSRAGTSEPTPTGPGEGLVFSPGAPADISWSADCEQLCLMIPQARLEEELEHLLGRSVRGGLVFDFAADLRGALGRRWRTTLDLLADELDAPTDLVSNPLIGRHVEALVLDGLLLGQRHNHSETAWRDGPAGLGGPVRQAIELIEERASEPWTTVRLAAAVHLSVRALQEGFRRDLGSTPMTYLREIRLRRAREALTEAEPTDMTVRAIAVNVGILHMSRFAAAYREAFGEMPSETLNRPN